MKLVNTLIWTPFIGALLIDHDRIKSMRTSVFNVWLAWQISCAIIGGKLLAMA